MSRLLRAVLLLGFSSLTATASAQTVVETYSGTSTYTFALPGTPSGPGFDFAYTETATTLSFTPQTSSGRGIGQTDCSPDPRRNARSGSGTTPASPRLG